MRNSSFQFKQFTIHQAKAVMKVCTDACIFGASIDADKAKSVLDIGTGTGLLALMIAQKSQGQITAIEIEQNAFDQAFQNVKASPWHDRIKVIHADIQSFALITSEKFDLIICNPPFFQQHLKSNIHAKNTAKHDETLSFEDLAYAIGTFLSDNGECHILLPEYEASLFVETVQKHGIFQTSSIIVRQKLGTNIFRVINKFRREKTQQVAVNELFIYKSASDYSDEFKAVLSPYYLNL